MECFLSLNLKKTRLDASTQKQCGFSQQYKDSNGIIRHTYSVMQNRAFNKKVKKGKVKSPIVNSALSQLCDLRARCSSPLTGLEPAVSCKHSSVIWAVGHTTPIYCRYLSYLPSG